MKEITVISGKGGTGKTSVTAALAALAGGAVLVDGDVDAANLHLLLNPRIRRRKEFRCGHEAVIRPADCTGCGICRDLCRFDAIRLTDGGARFCVDATGCEGCGVCVRACPAQAIDFPERTAGEWYVSDTRHGPMVHARLNPGGENSGKLIARLRDEARLLAKEQALDLVLLDGPPGIGCPAIASLTGASLALIVTEPTLSGLHDVGRVFELVRHFNIPAQVCVNKWDIHPALTERIEHLAAERGAPPAGRIRYDRAVTDAQVQGGSILEMPASPAADDLRALWTRVRDFIGERSNTTVTPSPTP